MFNESKFEVSDLSSLSSQNVSQLLARLSTQMQELNPSVDLKRGVFKDTILYFHAVLETAIRENFDKYQLARSLAAVRQNPALADAAIVDEILSNWLITRKTSTKATGTVTVELTTPRAVTIPQGFIFSAKGRRYQSTATFVSRPNQNQIINSNDRPITQLANQNWAFTITVEALEGGPESKLNAGDLIIPDRGIVGQVTSYASAAFASGESAETNDDLLNSLILGVSSKSLSNRTNMRAWLRNRPEFSAVVSDSVIGAGDVEMLRDKHNLFGISLGGKVDWYLRGQQSLQKVRKTLQAQLISIRGSVSTWAVTLEPELFPALYEVTAVRRVADQVNSSGFAVVYDERVLGDLPGVTTPDLINRQESDYTAFQKTLIRFEDTATPTNSLNLLEFKDYVVEAAVPSQVRELQLAVSNRNTKHLSADVVVRGAIPCFVRVSFTINKNAGDTDPNLNAISDAVSTVVNSTDFIGRLDSSRIVKRIHDFLPASMSVTDMFMIGRIRRPGGQFIFLQNDDSLVVPTQPDFQVTARTVQFFCDSDSVSIALKSNAISPQ